MTKVFINAGHDPESLAGTSDYDCGAVNRHLGLYENLVAASVGALVEKYMTAAGCEVNVLQDESLSGICEAANEWGADLFVSIHCNAFNETARGTETHTYPGDKDGYRLAECINNQIVSSLPVLDRGVKQSKFTVLSGTEMPAVLVEMAFIDEDRDGLLLRDNQDDFARAIARGVTDYLTGVGK